MNAEHYPVVIIGTGPTGMVAASLLARFGVDCLVLDRWTDVFAQPRAVHLDDEVYRILGELGLADDFASISRPGHGLRLIDRRLRTIAEFTRDPDSAPHGFPPANMFDQPELEQIMRAAMNRYDSVTFRGECEVTDVANKRDHAVVRYTDRASGADRFVTADYVLGCDGARSTVRSAIGSKMRDLGFEQRWLVIDVATGTDLQQWDGVHQLADPDRAGTYMRIGESRYRWEFRLHDHETTADFSNIDTVRPLIAPWIGTTANVDLELIRVAEYTFRAQVVDRWRDRRVFLLGDAAHLTPPFIGQGMGAGVRDAKNLIWKLVGVLHGVLPNSALETYQQERGPHADAMIKLAVTIGWAMTGGGERTAALRQRLFPLLARLPGVAARVTDSATPALHRSAYVRRAPGLTRGLAGTLCPNAIIDRGKRFDDVAPDQFVIVSLTAPTGGQHREILRRGAAALVVGASSELGEWLRGAHASAALVRPDKTVMATSRSLASLHTLVPASAVPVAGRAQPPAVPLIAATLSATDV
ncbi:bifunctional 3-(3-hydroxy-phenyl)propionate/3-hydroxycinnamic acid hydroxylase MhpA [Rhodococcus tibetensis]|uniref:Bifunctional 3-(3-hydroxy-phenyl)propionate/3-hydroxycinnamic acid hydroxylase n=1 Tax=Rhodococcus tibetensis TaxID=2965064 RepID=A0ABT1QFJ9_9NOCA|nr:bifunctional 3-(3-hydroxy-phenyl)propionate/3-hydroxycinnamic acid hydroxylase [Rhodococcus sp. FXJ9.536]MCQ4121038.1 bifunctional 3-(3-hydroxy-phenyl)propionate/3-hydroxycinnamic acid hydroxylase [Rhodococcus sp. FXJ9.536]